jgi:DMSO/TMAO reductase YedYZ molybdopterin-dependent catalytic subunit
VRPSREASDVHVAGAVATALALSVLWLSSALIEGAPFAPAALAEGIIRVTPGGVATFFIESLGHFARPLVTLGVVAGAFAIGTLSPALTARGGKPKFALVGAVLAAAAAAAMLASPNQDADPLAVVAVVALAGCAYTLTARALWRSGEVADEEADPRRRQMLKVGIGGVLAVSLGGGLIGWIASRMRGPNTDVALVAPATPAAPPPDGGAWPDIPGLTPEITSAADHYVVDINIIQPTVEAEDWTLRVFGDVDNPMEFTFSELQHNFEVVQEFSVLACVSNEVGGTLVGHSAWGGVRLADVLDRAGLKSDGVDVIFRAADGYSDSIPLDVARRATTLIAVSQNGRPLTQEHGFPCRVRVPSIYGMKNVKWLESIEVVPVDYDGYWQDRGWSDEAVVKTQSRIDVAGDDFQAVVGRPAWIAGVAWAGDREVSRVEVSVDGGRSWTEARLKNAISDLSWRLWAYRWVPDRAGDYVVMCRATDGTGTVQTAAEADPHPDGASGYDSATVQVA